ncbi:hypothetical protein C8Q77DRAFT_1124445 [Trametes polyzona]|nr:hypothetical protein C8Q77DRAFT_1124445 [Trametes polyzona]
MSRQVTPAQEETLVSETMQTEESTQGATQAADGQLEPSEAKTKKARAPDTLVREPGKSVLPYSRVQKVLKADKELVMVQREATFLISRATEEFIARLAEAAQRLAEREMRTTVQEKDIVATVRRAEEFAFLEELFPWSEVGKTAKREPKARQDAGEKDKPAENRAPTLLDQFMQSNPALGADGMDAVENEDGTMSGGPAEDTLAS